MTRRTVFLFLLFFGACSNRSGIPKEVLQPADMQKLMRDVVEAEQYSAQYISRDSLIKDKVKANQSLLDTIFSIHRISRETFKTSLTFYESRPDLTKNLFDSLNAYANRHRSEIYAPKLKPMVSGKTPEK